MRLAHGFQCDGLGRQVAAPSPPSPPPPTPDSSIVSSLNNLAITNRRGNNSVTTRWPSVSPRLMQNNKACGPSLHGRRERQGPGEEGPRSSGSTALTPPNRSAGAQSIRQQNKTKQTPAQKPRIRAMLLHLWATSERRTSGKKRPAAPASLGAQFSNCKRCLAPWAEGEDPAQSAVASGHQACRVWHRIDS